MNETQSSEPQTRPTSASSGSYRFLLPALAIFILVFWYSSRSRSPAGPPVDMPTALAKAADQNKPLLLKFEAGWCGPCQWMKEEVFSKDEIKKALEDWVVLDVDYDNNRKLAGEYRVQGVPTFVALSPQGNEIVRQQGPMPAEQMLAFLNAVKSRINSSS